MRRTLLLASLFALATAWPAAAALVNGSFEPAPGAAPPGMAIPGWLASPDGIAWVSAGGEDVAAPSGDWMVSLAGGPARAGTLEQRFVTTPGQTYDLLFWLGSRGGGEGRAELGVDVAGVSRTLALDNPAPELLWQAQVVTFTATAPVTRLRFRGESRTGESEAWLDGVVVRPAASAMAGPREAR